MRSLFLFFVEKIGSISFGKDLVRGKSLLPLPAAVITAFINIITVIITYMNKT